MAGAAGGLLSSLLLLPPVSKQPRAVLFTAGIQLVNRDSRFLLGVLWVRVTGTQLCYSYMQEQ